MEKQQRILEQQLGIKLCTRNNWPALAMDLLYDSQWGVSRAAAFGASQPAAMSELREMCEQWALGNKPPTNKWAELSKTLVCGQNGDSHPLAWYVCMSATNSGYVRNTLYAYVELEIPGRPSTNGNDPSAHQEIARRKKQLTERILALDLSRYSTNPPTITTLDL